MNGHKKGQYFSFDAIIATLIFILTMVSIFSYWYNTRSALENQNSEMMREAARISDMIFMISPSGPAACKVSFGISESNQQQSYRTLTIDNPCSSEPDLQKGYGTPYGVYIEFLKNPAYDSQGRYSTDSPISMGVRPSATSETVKLRRVAAIYDPVGSPAYSKAVVDIYVYEN